MYLNILNIIRISLGKLYYNLSLKLSITDYDDKYKIIFDEHISDDFIRNSVINNIESKINNIKIKSFNITLVVKRDAGDKYDVDHNPIYGDNWKYVTYSFCGSLEKDEETDGFVEPILGLNNVGFFYYERNGDESLNLYNKSWFSEYEPVEDKRVKFNYFDYNKFEELLNNLIELDNLLDKHYDEKMVIVNRLIETTKKLMKNEKYKL